MEVIKIILNHDQVLAGKLLLYDGSACSFRTIKLRGRRKVCDVCGESPTIKELIDYELFCGMAATDKDSGLNLLDVSERITVEEFSKLNQNHLLIDVRSANEFEICQLNNSINVPIKSLLADKIDEKLRQEMKQKDVFVVCRRGNDSQLAVKYLSEKQSIKSRDLIGGLHEWAKVVDKNFPVY